jgi:hypothetical protein
MPAAKTSGYASTVRPATAASDAPITSIMA